MRKLKVFEANICGCGTAAAGRRLVLLSFLPGHCSAPSTPPTPHSSFPTTPSPFYPISPCYSFLPVPHCSPSPPLRRPPSISAPPILHPNPYSPPTPNSFSPHLLTPPALFKAPPHHNLCFFSPSLHLPNSESYPLHTPSPPRPAQWLRSLDPTRKTPQAAAPPGALLYIERGAGRASAPGSHWLPRRPSNHSQL